MQSPIIIIPWIVSITLTITMGIYAQRRRQNLAAIPFAAMCYFASWWSIFYITGLLSLNLEFKILMAKIMYIGVLGVPLSWTAFSLAFSGRGAWLSRRNIALALILPTLTYIIVWTTDKTGLHWHDLALIKDPVTGLIVLNAPAGWWFWIHAAYIYGILVLGTYFLVRQFWAAQNIYRWQILIVIVAIFAPWVANVLVVFSIVKTLVDITSLTFTFSILLLGWAYFRYGFLDLVPVAQRAVFDNIPDSIVVLDTALRIVELNPASLSMFGLGSAPAIGQPFSRVFGQWLPFEEAQIQTNGFKTEVSVSLGNSPSKWYEANIATLFDNPSHIAGHLIVLRDITSFKTHESELADARDEAIRATGFKTQLLANVSHELRTPLGVIAGYTDLLVRGTYGENSEKQTVILNRVRESTQYLDNLVSELIDQAQLDSGKVSLAITSFEPREVFGQVFNQISVLADTKGLTFNAAIAADFPVTIVGDSQRLKQILVNLLSNAIKFTENGEVTANIAKLGPDQWTMQVKDSGVGIPEESLNEIFEPFRQLDPAQKHLRKGYGLGLSISKQFTELMGGSIKAVSVLNKGTTFTVTLPLKTMFNEGK